MIALNILALGFVAAIGVFLLSIFIGAFFIWIGAKLARVEKGTFGRAFIAAITASVASWLVAWLFSFISGPWWSLIGGLIGLIVVLWVFKSMFDTTWGKAFLIWILQVFAILVAVLIGILTFATALWV